MRPGDLTCVAQCRQLRKECGYPSPSRIRSARPEEVTFLFDRLKLLEQRLNSEASHEHPAQPESQRNSFALEAPSIQRLKFPAAFFLELENYCPMPPDQLNPQNACPIGCLELF